MTLYLDSDTGDVHHDDELVGNAGEGPYLLEEDIIDVVVSEELPNDNAPVKGTDLETVLVILRDDRVWGRPEQS
jgi:hypothetical protein